jgi:hypothetical protein
MEFIIKNETETEKLVTRDLVLELTHDIETQWRAWGIWEDRTKPKQGSPSPGPIAAPVLSLFL